MREDAVHHVLLLGDRKEAARWIPWSKHKFADLQRYDPGFSGKSFGKRKYTHDIVRENNDFEGFVLVELKMVNKEKWIIIWAIVSHILYMESGILDHRNLAPFNRETYMPSILHYGEDIVAIRGDYAELGELKTKEAEPNKLQGENRGEGDSEAVGCPKEEKQDQITVSSTFHSETFEATKPIFCTDLSARKDTQSKMPASMFSGKMRLLVQSIYGSKREDYSIDETFGIALPLQFEHGTIGYLWGSDNGLFSASNYEYFVIGPTQGGIYARKLVPTPAGEAIRKYLREKNDTLPEARRKRYEAYLLSTLYYTADNLWVKIGEPGQAYDKGSPWFYGWHWNTSGTEARVVCIRRKPQETNEVYQSTHFRLSVHEMNTDGVLEEGTKLVAATGIEEDTEDWTFVTNNDLVWYPDVIEGGMIPFIPAGANEPITQIDSDAPQYVVANSDDTFDVVRFKRTDLGGGQGSFGGLDYGSGGYQNFPNNPPVCDTEYCGFATRSDSAVEKGFYVERSGVWTGVRKSGENVDLESIETRLLEGADTGTETGTGGTVYGNCSGLPTPAGDGVFVHVSATGVELKLAGDFVVEGMLVVPYYDADAVYVGFWDKFNGSVDLQTVPVAAQQEVVAYKRVYDSTSGALIFEDLINWQWGAAPESRSLVNRAVNAGTYVHVGVNATWNHVDVRLLVNGEALELHKSQRVDDAGLATYMAIPSCAQGETGAIDELTSLPWEEGDADLGGWDEIFDPILFFVLDPGGNAPSIRFRRSYNFNSYHGTKKPGEEDGLITEGGYGYNNIDNNLFSYVGFA